MRMTLATLLLLHGVVHIVGFVGAFQLVRRVPYQISMLGEQLDSGDLGARLLGVLWLLAATAFAIAAAAVFADADWWQPYTAVVATFSLLLCILGWPGSKIGIPIDLTILLAMLVATRPDLWAYLIAWVRLIP